MQRRPGLAIIVVVVLAGCAGIGGPAASPTLPPAAITIEAGTKVDDSASAGLGGYSAEGGYIFAPSTVEIQAGDIVRLVDIGNVEHDLTIDVGGGVPEAVAQQDVAVKIHVDLLNRTNQAAIDLPPGTYQFYCSIGLGSTAGHANNGMVGTITVH